MTKKVYRVRNWKDYNESLVRRGSITFWFDEETLKTWHNCGKTGQRGRPQKYADAAIMCGLTLKAVFKLTFRSVEGFIGSLIELLQMDIKAPSYSLLCKRQKDLDVVLPKRSGASNERIHIVVDSTGLKVYGEGEWKVRQHGYVKHRLWRKLHLAINSKTQIIESFELTDLGTQDCEGLPMLLNQIDEPIESVAADGAYDRFSCYEEAEQRDFTLITPPQKNARTSDERPRNKKKASTGAVKRRDDVIKNVRQMGRAEWKIDSEYHRRSLAETGVFRIKTLLGNKLSTRVFENQRVEIAVWCSIINKMTMAGMPRTVSV